MRWGVLVVFGLLGCGAEVPVVALDVTQAEGTAPILGLERLRLVVQSCGQAEPLFAQNLVIRGDRPPIEAPLLPGTAFYAWLQGWLECVGPCVPPESAQPGDCTCVTDGDTAPAQLLSLEACTDWATAETGVTLKLTLAPPAGLCPPAPKEGCAR